MFIRSSIIFKIDDSKPINIKAIILILFICSCYYDYLQIFDGPNPNSTSIGKYCGQTFNPVSSSGRFMTLVFVTNYGTQAAGFKLHFNRTHTLTRKFNVLKIQLSIIHRLMLATIY